MRGNQNPRSLDNCATKPDNGARLTPEETLGGHPPPPQDLTTRRHMPAMNYREFTIALEHRLGTRYLLVDREAKEPGDLLLPTGVHDRLLREILRAVYKACECYHIRAPLDGDRALAVIAPIQTSLRDAADSDIDVIRLVDELFCAAEELLRAASPHAAQDPAGVEELPPASVIPLPALRA